MALAYDVSDSIVRAVLVGRHTIRELQTLLDVGMSDPRAASPPRVLIDASDGRLAASLAEVLVSADSLASSHTVTEGRCAVVVNEPFRRLLSWTLTAHARRLGVEVRTFDDRGQASRWLHDSAASQPPAAGH
jgi:hypothetical protein